MGEYLQKNQVQYPSQASIHSSNAPGEVTCSYVHDTLLGTYCSIGSERLPIWRLGFSLRRSSCIALEMQPTACGYWRSQSSATSACWTWACKAQFCGSSQR